MRVSFYPGESGRVCWHAPPEGELNIVLRRAVRTLRSIPSRLRRGLAERSFDRTDLPARMPYLWSKGVAQLCDFHGPPGYWLAPTESVADESMFRDAYGDAAGLVWVRLGTQSRDGRVCDLDRFVAGALPSIRRPFVLITTDGDISVPSELPPATVDALLASPWLVAWYTQNHDGGGAPRIAPFPIGLDLATPRPFSSPRRLAAEFGRIAAAARPATERPLRVLCDIGLSLASADRIAAVRALAGCPHVEMQRRRVSQREIWERYARHAFVLSLRGNGLDCHRTWEALYLGSIVITRASSLDPLFDGLPVVRVKSWDEICDPGNLARWLQLHGPLAASLRIGDRLDAPSWLARIRRRHLPSEVSA